MEGGLPGGGRGDPCPQLLDLIPKDRKWLVGDGGGRTNGYEAANEKQLELSLAPPGGGGDWSVAKVKKEDPSVLSLGIFSMSSKCTINPSAGAKRGFTHTLETESEGYEQKQQQKTRFLHFQSTAAGMGKESSSQKTADGMKAEQQRQLSNGNKACPKAATPSATPAASGNPTLRHNRPQTTTRTSGPAPVVGWPPIRSFRKNIASSSSKPSPVPEENVVSEKPQKLESCSKGMFVKINMDGIPIGRKVDLKAYDSYERLSTAVDELFRGLLAVQRENHASGTPKSAEENPAITCLLDGSGEYTLVYEDTEGDRLLVGDVPWDMFVSMVKRLRVWKSSELSSALSLGAASRKRTAPGLDVQ